MKQLLILMTLIGFSSILLGCANCCGNQPQPIAVAPVVPIETPEPPEPVRVQALGYGAESNYADYNSGQRRLMAIRAAKVDAYRSLGEQIYGVYVSGQSRVSAATIQIDTVRTYIDAFVRGARVVGIVPMANSTYEVTLEATLDVNFFECLNYRRPGCPRSFGPPPYQPAYVSHGAYLH